MVKIDDTYYIDADNNCYTLKLRTTIQDENSVNFGKEIFKDLGCYTTLDGLLKGLIKRELRDFISQDDRKTLKELIIKIDELKNYIEKLDLKI